MKRMAEPTTNSEPKPTVMHEPVKRTEPNIAPDPKPHRKSVQVHEPQHCIAVGLLVAYEGMEESPAHTPTAVSELQLAFEKIHEDLEKYISLILPSLVGPAQVKVSCALGSTSIGQVSVSRPPGVISQVSTMAPSSLVSAVGHRSGYGLSPHLAPAAPTSSPLWSPSLSSPQVFSPQPALRLPPESCPPSPFGRLQRKEVPSRAFFNISLFHQITVVSELQLASAKINEVLEEDISLILPSWAGPAQLKVSWATGSAQLEVSCVSRVPTQPPSPTTSYKFS